MHLIKGETGEGAIMVIQAPLGIGKSTTLEQVREILLLTPASVMVAVAASAMAEFLDSSSFASPIITSSSSIYVPTHERFSQRNKGDVAEMRKREKKAQKLEWKTRNRGKWK
jgi:predicted ATP-binding protein involved in virulence